MDSLYSDLIRYNASFDWGLYPGTIVVGVAANGEVQLVSTAAASGGEGAITYSWYHSVSPPTDTNWGSLIGGSSADNTDSRSSILTAGNHYYTRVATDTYGRQALAQATATIQFERSWGIDRYHMLRRK